MSKSYTIENMIVYEHIGEVYKAYVGPQEKTETIRVDNETVADVVSLFDLELGEYVEQSRTERAEPLSEPEPTPEQEIAQLKTENLSLKLTIAELGATAEQDKIDMQLALAELAEIITGGVE